MNTTDAISNVQSGWTNIHLGNSGTWVQLLPTDANRIALYIYIDTTSVPQFMPQLGTFQQTPYTFVTSTFFPNPFIMRWPTDGPLCTYDWWVFDGNVNNVRIFTMRQIRDPCQPQSPTPIAPQSPQLTPPPGLLQQLAKLAAILGPVNPLPFEE